MFDACFHQALAVLEPLAPSGAGSDAAHRSQALAALRVVRGGLDAVEAGLLAGLEPAAAVEVLTAAGTSSTRQARKVAARAELLTEAPELAAGLTSGALSGEHLDAVAHVASGLEPDARAALIELGDDLVSHGKKTTPELFGREVRRLGDLLAGDDGLARFERQRRATGLQRGVDRDSGMHWLRAQFDPETGAALFTALQRRLDHWYHHPDLLGATAVVPELADDHQHLAAHALTQLCRGIGTQLDDGDGDGPVGPATTASPATTLQPAVVPMVDLSVLVDLRTLRHGLHPHSVCETSSGVPLPPATIRRLACDAGIIPTVMGGPSVPLDLGRSRRLASRAQRQALRAAHRTCVVPGCTIPFDWCQIHHLTDWTTSNGRTDLAELAPLCHRHHHMVHEDGDTLTLDPQREATLHPPAPRANPPPARAG